MELRADLLRYSEEPWGEGSSQMWKFAASLKCYANGEEPPEGYYPGEFTKGLALELAESVPLDAPLWMWKVFGGNRVISGQEADLAVFGVFFDTWSYESDLNSPGATGVVTGERVVWSQFMREHNKAGYAYIDGADGRPICGHCGRYLVPEIGCPICTTGQTPPSSTMLDGLRRLLITDPCLHPDNDFMPGEQ